MGLQEIGIMAVLAGVIGWRLDGDRRVWALLAASVVGLYVLQPSLVIRYLDVALPTLTLGLTFVAWLAVTGRTRPALVIVSLVVFFAVLKWDVLTVAAASGLRRLTGRDPSLASSADVVWIGYSYIAFRLIHTLRDAQSSVLPRLSLRDYLAYVLFFPALTAGPIDRAERFGDDLRESARLTNARLVDAGTRIAVGVFKKFAVADSLALVALDATNAEQATSAGGLWLLTYAYGLRLFFDFSGYTDVAIGIGKLAGIDLPENFARPYFKPTIAAFWQSWHITLSDWVRTYVFAPVSRWLMLMRVQPALLTVFAAQAATMLTIGLWHSVTWNFALWGLWHAVGLFIQKVWSDRTRRTYIKLRKQPRLRAAANGLGVIVTFHYVTLGWVWFALPTPALAWSTVLGLFGL